MLRIGFDVDEVVCLLVDKISLYLKEAYDIEFKPEELSGYCFSSHPSIGNDTEVFRDLKLKFSDSSLAFYKDCLPDKDGVNVIKKLKRSGHIIYFISGRPRGAEDKTAIWLRKNKIPFNYIKHIGNQDKGYICRSLNLDFYMDDNPEALENILKYKKDWPRGLAILDKPWNRSYLNDKVLRVKSWYDLLRKIN